MFCPLFVVIISQLFFKCRLFHCALKSIRYYQNVYAQFIILLLSTISLIFFFFLDWRWMTNNYWYERTYSIHANKTKYYIICHQLNLHYNIIVDNGHHTVVLSLWIHRYSKYKIESFRSRRWTVMLVWVTKIQCRIISHIIIIAKTVFSDVLSCRDLIRTNKTLSWPFVRKFHNVHIVLSIKKKHIILRFLRTQLNTT